jgi:hypothetical protein
MLPKFGDNLQTLQTQMDIAKVWRSSPNSDGYLYIYNMIAYFCFLYIFCFWNFLEIKCFFLEIKAEFGDNLQTLQTQMDIAKV